MSISRVLYLTGIAVLGYSPIGALAAGTAPQAKNISELHPKNTLNQSTALTQSDDVDNTSLVANKPFTQCIASLESSAVRSGVSSHTFQTLTQKLEPDASLLEKLNYQPEFRTPIWDYISALVDEERVEDGRSKMRQYKEALKRIEQQYGVDPTTVVAVWGVESNFGQNQGKYSLVQALGTLSCMGRRQAFFRKELFAAMRIIQSGDIPAERLNGSWAGAFGHTQFMPTTFERLAVDFDKDGRRDLIDNSVDALGSTANYLAKAGWRTGEPWGFEVKLPQGMSTAGEGRKQKKPLTYWIGKGVKTVDNRALDEVVSDNLRAGLLLPAGVNGPAFLVFRNFDVIYSYNAAESYALAIAHLSDRLRGDGPFVTPWPTDDLGLSRAERRELQKLLIQHGYEIGPVDGAIGALTREAIKSEQKRLGLKVDGRAGQKILKALKSQ